MEIEQIPAGLGHPQDAVEGAAGDAHLAPGLASNPADGLESRGIRSESGDEDPPGRLRGLREQPGVNAFF